MKKEKRIPYLILSEIDCPDPTGESHVPWNITLCHLCKYAEWWSSGSLCNGECDLECKHPLEDFIHGGDQNNMPWATEGDCWGFYPGYKREDCVDAVGIMLRGEVVDWSTLRETGRKKEE